jgi:hypothetical protein
MSRTNVQPSVAYLRKTCNYWLHIVMNLFPEGAERNKALGIWVCAATALAAIPAASVLIRRTRERRVPNR